MTKSLRAKGLLYVFLAMVFFPADSRGQSQCPDSLELRTPQNVFVVPEMNPNRERFINWIFWDQVAPENCGVFIHPPDTTGWRPKGSQIPPELLSYPMSDGVYLGSIDQTATFVIKNSGEVGVGNPATGRQDVVVRFNIIGREFLNGFLNIGQGYTPEESIPCIFTNTETGDRVDFGLRVKFAEGFVDSNGVFVVGMEDFEGYHCWRGIERDGSDLVNIGEMSKEEAARPIPFDSLYYFEMIPALRETGVYRLPEPVPGLGSTIDVREVLKDQGGTLRPNQLFWVDRNAFNGFTYSYVVTTFDRGYNVKATSQGLRKIDSCPVAEGVPFPCNSEVVRVKNELEPGRDLPEIYAVPNPYRSGSSQYTTENYHNFPDNNIRICNVPKTCKVHIYTVSGDLVWTKTQEDGSGVLIWDTRNLEEQEVASGVYIMKLESGSGNYVYNRLVIIR
ncbi:MAG: T9SS type A sorting domain-containing protein [Candidatus Latescibacterota bacterium]|nr:MAG: T9SS type A sorting domain-containing protein [Candidatus Latescibacterota bacterium]